MQTARGASLSDADDPDDPAPGNSKPGNSEPSDPTQHNSRLGNPKLGNPKREDSKLVDSGPAGAHLDRRRDRRILGLFGVVAGVTYLLDQITKYLAIHRLDPTSPRQVFDGVLRLDLARNAGAAFSTGRGYTIVLSLVALGVIAVILRAARSLRSRTWAVALGLILGGALGNVSDRLFRAPGPLRGHVVDFLQLPHWPIFNVADVAISSAAFLFVWLSVRGVRLDGGVEG
jgi:signal peptidase II